jgi:transcriptional regulator with XRE-family HTH domain
VAYRIEALAKQQGISINKLLTQNGLAKSTVSNMKSGRGIPTADKLAIIARALDTDVFHLLAMDSLLDKETQKTKGSNSIMTDKKTCYLCGATIPYHWLKGNVYLCQCPNCGEYYSADNFERFGKKEIGDSIYLLSGLARQYSDNGNRLKLEFENISNILADPLIPKTTSEKINCLLMYVYKYSFAMSDYVDIKYPAIGYAKNVVELNKLLNHIVDLRLMKKSDPNSQRYTLTIPGYQRCEEIEKTSPQSTSAFVAMWFDKKLNFLFDDVIQPVAKAHGFDAHRIDRHEHNNEITDEIIAQIKASKFVIADLTGYRGGVYYEAGYAKGLERTVIFTCRSDYFKGEKWEDDSWRKEKVHFDIDHINIIEWQYSDNSDNNRDAIKEFARKLSARIDATISGAGYLTEERREALASEIAASASIPEQNDEDIKRSEIALVDMFREFNQEGQEKILDDIDTMIKSKKYENYRKSNVAEQA